MNNNSNQIPMTEGNNISKVNGVETIINQEFMNRFSKIMKENLSESSNFVGSFRMAKP